jgi:hypothetical protein
MVREYNALNNPGCLRHASGQSLPRRGVQRVLQYLCKQGACIEIQDWRGLTGTLEVRMVWWGFRALKTPEERPICRRFSVGCDLNANPVQNQRRPSAVQKQWLGKTGANWVRNECSSRARCRAI